MEEEWRPAPGFEEFLIVSSYGRVVNLRTQIHLPHHRVPGGLFVRFGIGGREYTVMVGRLVLAAFVRPPKGKELVRYLDGNNCNPRLENVAWETRKDRCARLIAEGRRQPWARI